MATRILSVSSIDLQTLESDPLQLSISVTGTASTPGWTGVELRPLEKKVSPDGILDLEFIGTPPSGIVPQVLTPASASLIWTKDVERIVGVRVVARTNELTRLRSLQVPDPVTVHDLIGRPVRCYTQGDPLTRDFRPNRVNIETDQNDIILRIWFG